MNIQTLGEKVLFEIKSAPWFPYKTGNLKFNATSGRMINQNTYLIHFDGTIAPYVAALEEGSSPHDIFPKTKSCLAFKVNDKLVFAKKVHHPGSTKHKGFISEKCINTIIDYITTHYEGNCYDIVK